MSAYEVAPGDKVQAGDPVVVTRYTAGARINHWITAASLVLLALSGLALFHPSLFWLTGLFGGGQTTRMIHPWIGVVLFFSFFGLFLRFWKANLWEHVDNVWLARTKEVLTGHEERLPEVGKSTHYHAYWVHPWWTRTMTKISKIGVHTFYRPRKWGDGSEAPAWGDAMAMKSSNDL